MNNHSALETLIELATTATDEAAKRLGQALRSSTEANAKLEMLQQYREEYAARFQSSMASGLSVMGIRNFHLFLEKLDAAIEGQKRVSANLQAGVEHEKQAWRENERKRRSYGTLAERAQRQEQRKDDKRAQKAMDEHAARQLLYRHQR
jgi:flagellar FliJ protein